MTDRSDLRVLEAKVAADAARARLDHTIGSLRARLAPRSLASEAWAEARQKSATVASAAARQARARPLASVGILALICVFLFRKPLFVALAQRFRRPEETTMRDEGSAQTKPRTAAGPA